MGPSRSLRCHRLSALPELHVVLAAAAVVDLARRGRSHPNCSCCRCPSCSSGQVNRLVVLESQAVVPSMFLSESEVRLG